MNFRPHSLKEFGLQYLRKNRNSFRPKTDDLGAFLDFGLKIMLEIMRFSEKVDITSLNIA